MITISSNWLLLVLISVFAAGCHSPTNPTKKLNVDHNIPPSAPYDASYGFWGPDGKTIYYTHSKKLGSNPEPGRLDQLWKLNLKTGQRQMIHTGRILFADISPNGKWIVFNSFALPQYLYKMRSDGTKLQKLTGPNSPNPSFEYTIEAKWSINGNHVLFGVSAGVPRGVSLMDSNGANAIIIIPYGVQPSWSPDGKKIVYLNWDSTKVHNNQEQIYIANTDGSHRREITDFKNTYFNIYDPSFSPDGQRVVFTLSGEVYIMNANGTDVKRVTIGRGKAKLPKWSPDGQTILFSRIIPNVSERLYYLNVATHQVTPVFPASKNNHAN